MGPSQRVAAASNGPLQAQAPLPPTAQYDATAEAYEAAIVPRFRAVAEILLAAAAPRPTEAVLEVAAGTGGLARLVVPRLGPGGRIVITDISEGMLVVARRVLRDVNAHPDVDVQVVRADLAALPFGPATFDLVLAQFTPLQDSDDGLREVRRVLRERGRVALVHWANAYAENRLLNEARRRVGMDPYPVVDPPAIAARAAASGFGAIEQREVELPLRFDRVADYLEYRMGFGAPPSVDADVFERYRVALAEAATELAPDGRPLELGWKVIVMTAAVA